MDHQIQNIDAGTLSTHSECPFCPYDVAWNLNRCLFLSIHLYLCLCKRLS